jgi:thiamine biosynthesis protein ThiI
MMRDLILVRYGEIALKGKNIRVFQKKFYKNIKKAVVQFNDVKVIDQFGRVYVECDSEDLELVIQAVTNVFGVVSVSPAIRVENDIEIMEERARQEVERLRLEEGAKTFKIETKRSNKGFPMTSPEINKRVGGYINQSIPEMAVDVHNPDILLTLEIRNWTYMFSKRYAGLGGMPYGSAGKGILLLSGGIDSPVAGYLMARRGMELEAVHFHSYPFTSERALEKVIDLGRRLTHYTRTLKIHSINILEIQKSIDENCPSEEMTILSRVFMMQLAQRVAEEVGGKCLITGENLGQVASQTMEGLTVTNTNVDIPVLRPLIAYDKVEIIDIAKKIDTFETSILPYEDCCTVFLPDRVVTKPRVDKISASLELVDREGLIEEALARKEMIIISEGEVLAR